MTEATAPTSRLSIVESIPIGFFGIVTGLVGMSGAWRVAHLNYGLPLWPSDTFAYLSFLAFGVLSAAYALKAALNPDLVTAEFQHPVTGNVFGLIPICLLLLPIPLARLDPFLALLLWYAGTILMVLFAWMMVHRWLTEQQQPGSALPAWLIPVAGPLNIPLAAPSLNLVDQHDILVFGFAVGAFFSVILLPVLISRLLFQQSVPVSLRPGLMLLTAPFSIGYSAYLIVSGNHDLLAECLHMMNLFLVGSMLLLLRHLPRCCPFRVAWWGVSFPLASASIASLRFAGASPSTFSNGIAILLLTLCTVVVLWLIVRTLKGLVFGELRTMTATP